MRVEKPQKLQKVLADAGLGSRREMESWIVQGRVVVDGKIALLGERANHLAKIKIDGRVVVLKKSEKADCRVLLYHKPLGEICTRFDSEGRRTVFKNLPELKNARWINIGRLDINTSGLLLFTTEGEFANKLMHPSNQVEREYAVRVLGKVDADILRRLRSGVELEDGTARFESLRYSGGTGANHWYHVVLKEGRNREVRRLWESQGIRTSRLMRIRFGTIKLPRDLKPGSFLELTAKEISVVKKSICV